MQVPCKTNVKNRDRNEHMASSTRQQPRPDKPPRVFREQRRHLVLVWVIRHQVDGAQQVHGRRREATRAKQQVRVGLGQQTIAQRLLLLVHVDVDIVDQHVANLVRGMLEQETRLELDLDSRRERQARRLLDARTAHVHQQEERDRDQRRKDEIEQRNRRLVGRIHEVHESERYARPGHNPHQRGVQHVVRVVIVRHP